MPSKFCILGSKRAINMAISFTAKKRVIDFTTDFTSVVNTLHRNRSFVLTACNFAVMFWKCNPRCSFRVRNLQSLAQDVAEDVGDALHVCNTTTKAAFLISSFGTLQ